MTNKNKIIAVLAGLVIALIICYQFAISNTLEARDKYRRLQDQQSLTADAPQQLSVLRQKQTYYDSLLSKYQLKGSSVQNNLLKTLNGYAKTHDLKVVAFMEPHISVRDQLTIKTYQFTLEGSYNGIMSLVHNLEQRTRFGEIINLNFERKKNFRTGKSYLEASILLRSFG